MATDGEIKKFVQRHQGFVPKVGWIAHVKEVHGIPTMRGANRARRNRKVEPCPPEKRERDIAPPVSPLSSAKPQYIAIVI